MMADLFSAMNSEAAPVPFWPGFLCFGLLLVLCAVIAVIDWRHRLIPNRCNAAVALLGLAFSGFAGRDATLSAAVQGAAVFALFWAVRAVYRSLRPTHGLGLGDVKFLGAAGIWVGLGGVAPLLLVACTAALGFIGLKRWRGQTISARFAIPFGPFLALGLLVVLGLSRG